MFLIKKALSKMSFYQQNTIALNSWFLFVLSCNIFLMTFHGSIFLNIKLGPTTTLYPYPRRRGRGLHNLDSSHDQIRFFWLAEVRNFTNIMIEYVIDLCSMSMSIASFCLHMSLMVQVTSYVSTACKKMAQDALTWQLSHISCGLSCHTWLL